MDMDIQPLAVNLTRAARMLGVSRPTLTTRILPALKYISVGRRKLVVVTSIHEFLNSDENPDENENPNE
jgi:Bacterial regulatory protein, Fis family